MAGKRKNPLLHSEAISMDSRRYPQWWLDRAAARRRLLDVSVDLLRNDRGLPEMVDGMLVFGSYARDEVGPESDLDIIAVQRTTEIFALRGLAVRKRLAQILPVSFDLLVYTPEEYERFSLETSFLRQARQEGIWIDASPSA